MKLVILGDSISEGIGSKKVNYINSLKQNINKNGYRCDIYNLAKTGSTINYALELRNQIETINPDIIILMYGNVEAQIRPNIDKNRFYLKTITPRRYKNIGGMLDPRAFYSTSLKKKIPQKIDNVYRYIWKKILVKTQSTYQKIEYEMFMDKYKMFLEYAKENCYKVICSSTVYIDNKYFLNSSFEYQKYNYGINELSIKYDFKFINIYKILKLKIEDKGWNSSYYLDHFHPNALGLDLIAEHISNEIVNIIKENDEFK